MDEALLRNLKDLKEDMINKKWTICSFLFQYKKSEYIVLVKRFVGTEVRINPFALIKLHFMNAAELSNDMQVEANINGLLTDAKQLRKYFGIEYADNLGDILRQFTARFGSAIPKKMPDFVSDKEKTAMVYSLSKSDSEDPNKIYCHNVKRNSIGKRSEFNADKTKLLRPALFKHFCNEPNVSFCYYADPMMENNDATILRNFANGRWKKRDR